MTQQPVNADYVRHLLEAIHAASRDYDQAILTLSAGTLALSVTFVDRTATPASQDARGFLVVGWIALAVSLASILISFLSSQRVLRDQLAHVQQPEWRPGRSARVTDVLNITGGVGLISGLTLLGVYAIQTV